MIHCYTCNTPVLPAGGTKTGYLYTDIQDGQEYVFCSYKCKTTWAEDDTYDA